MIAKKYKVSIISSKQVHDHSNGRFRRIIQPFSLSNFNDGYVNINGRFVVYMPDNPRSHNDGYIFRAIAAYELYHNISVPKTMCIHHIDDDKLNDSEENLLMIECGKHTSLHNKLRREKSLVKINCKTCNKEFFINKHKLNDPYRGKFCSKQCYYSYPKNLLTKKRQSKSMKIAHKNKSIWRNKK